MNNTHTLYMPTRSQHIAVAGFLTIATFAITSGIQSSPGIPAQLSDQPINVYSETEAVNGVTIHADEHNIVICPTGTDTPVATENLKATVIRFWVYKYSGKEPTIIGTFYISPGELTVHPQYRSMDTLRRIVGGERYYVMSSETLQFSCRSGLNKIAACGDGFVDEGTEQCDDGNDIPGDGCSQCTRDFCEDSDGGERFEIRGETKANAGETLAAADTCSGNLGEENMLYEYSCTRSNTIAMAQTICPHGCRDGACTAGPICGNGILERGEACDLFHEGCDWPTCTSKQGYVCANNVCKVYIPTLGGDFGGESDDAGGGSFGGDGGQGEELRQGVVLHSASITGAMFSVEYSKNFDTCVHVYTRNGFANHRSNFACLSGNHIGALVALSDFPNTTGIRRGAEIKLCHGNDTTLCSNFVVITGEESHSSSASSSEDTSGKIISVENANPDWDYSSIPTGKSRVGQFRFTAASSDALHPRRNVALETLLFTVNAKNTVISTADDVRFYNKADQTTNMRCKALYPDGSPYTATSISGLFLVLCENLQESIVNTRINPGAYETFVLELNVINPLLNSSASAQLQVSLENINLQTTAFGPGEGNSHVRWFSLGSGGSTEHLRFDIPTSVVKSTFYES
ncbi:MAG: hypothetical protein Greene101449_184 [Candidatus Peregrinibacteria bacterium Greene1014_49]|nr:MAG: hypothetical protein Greene101449_184 [Candidatus Peregrinibacteria bacterium Greene1014_49]